MCWMSLDFNIYDFVVKMYLILVVRLVGLNNCMMICGMIFIYFGVISLNIMVKIKMEVNEFVVS